MTTTTDALPLRPRGAARHAANVRAAAGAVPQTTGMTVTTPVIPVSTPGAASPATPADAATPADSATKATPAIGASEATTATPRAVAADARRASRPHPAPLPTRRTLRAESRPSAAADLGRAVTQAITLPLRTLGHAVTSAKAVPLTATAVAACLFVTVSTPQTAMAATPQATATAPVFDVQQYTVGAGFSVPADRDAFAIGAAPERKAPSAAPAPATRVPGAVRPVAGSIPTAGGFGSRWVAGCGACSTNHQGLDFAAPTGTTVVAAMPGRVVEAGVSGGYGNQVLLQHADGSQTRYGHLSRIDVRAGQTVSAGQRIGAVGSTGVSTGSHLHFEVIVGGAHVDPAAWLQARGLL